VPGMRAQVCIGMPCHRLLGYLYIIIIAASGGVPWREAAFIESTACLSLIRAVLGFTAAEPQCIRQLDCGRFSTFHGNSLRDRRLDPWMTGESSPDLGRHQCRL
jgi:hypothetical protein